jgi:hypothetical protein
MVNPTNQAYSQEDPKEVAWLHLQNAREDAIPKESAYNSCVHDPQVFRSTNFTTVEEFVQHGKDSVDGIILDFKCLFIAQNDDYHNIAMAYTSAKILNPISAATMSVVEMTDAMKDLGSHFGIHKFHEGHG